MEQWQNGSMGKQDHEQWRENGRCNKRAIRQDNKTAGQWTVDVGTMAPWDTGTMERWTMNNGTLGPQNWAVEQWTMGPWMLVHWTHGRWDRGTMRMEQWGMGESHSGHWDYGAVGREGHGLRDNAE